MLSNTTASAPVIYAAPNRRMLELSTWQIHTPCHLHVFLRAACLDLILTVLKHHLAGFKYYGTLPSLQYRVCRVRLPLTLFLYIYIYIYIYIYM